MPQTPQRPVHHERAELIFHARMSPCLDKICEKVAVFSNKCEFFTISRLRSEDALLACFGMILDKCSLKVQSKISSIEEILDYESMKILFAWIVEVQDCFEKVIA